MSIKPEGFAPQTFQSNPIEFIYSQFFQVLHLEMDA